MTHISLPPLRPLAAAVHAVLLCAAFQPLATAAQAGTDSTVSAAASQRYDIPAGTLAEVLSRYAAAAGVTLAFDAGQLGGLRSGGLQGDYSVAAGFARLLGGSGFEAVAGGEGRYSLRRLQARTETTLAPVAVTAQVEQGVVTEGSGAYTPRATAAATGLTLSQRETPQSVSVVTRQRIEDQNLVTLADILVNAPGIATQMLDSERTTFSARGFSIPDIQYDGISTAYRSNYATGESELDSAIYDRIEIVRGATGLLTGAGEPSASINLVRKRADSREFRGSVSLSAGSWDNYRGVVDIATPLDKDGRIRGRLVAAYQDKGAFFDRYSRQSQTIYGVVDVDLTPATTLSLGGSYQKSEAEGITYGGVPLWNTDGSTTHYSRSFSVAPKWNEEEIEITRVFLDLEHRFDNDWKAHLHLTRSHSEVDNSRLFVWGFPDATTGLVTNAPSRVRYPGENVQRSIDLKLSGPFALAGREHEAVVGFSRYDQDYAFYRIGAIGTWSSPFSVYDFGSVAEPAWNYAAPVLSDRAHTRQTAVYGALRLSLADPLKLILGGRLTRYDREGAGYNNANPYSYDDQKFSPYAGLVYDLSRNLSAYASYTSIFKYQDSRDRNGSWLEPVTGDAYEAGLKGEFFDGRLNASLAVFRIEQDNLAQQDVGYLVPGTSVSAYYGAEGATSRGVELELSGELARGWNAFFFATRYSAKDANGADVNTSLPRTMVRLFTTYRLPGDWQKLTVGGGANWQSRIYYDNVGPNGERQEQEGYLLASLMARYQFNPKVSLQLNVNNLFDRKYQTAVNWYGQGTWGTPRNVQATLNYQF